MPVTKEYINDALALMEGVDVNATDGALNLLADKLGRTDNSHQGMYQEAWANKAMALATGKDTTANMTELLEHMYGVTESDGFMIAAITGAKIQVNTRNFVQTDGHMIVIRDGKYEMVPNDTTDSRLVDAVVAGVTDSTQAVIEMGCGWGRNLAAAALDIPRRDITFVGLEPSEAGQECTEGLLSKDPTIQYRTGYFDFYNADFSLIEDFDDIVIFSCAAIEQVTLLDPKFIDQVLAIADKVTLIFYEPIGWQRTVDHQRFGAHTVLSEIMGNVPGPELHQLKYTFEMVDGAVDANAVSWAVICRYNLNLLSLIHNAIARSLVDLKSADYEIFGLNPLNPYSLFVLEKRN